jgi:predicted TIM-barrel fold metal-dependent hydrolase
MQGHLYRKALMPIIDMRSRPSFLHPFFGSTPGTAAFETVQWVNRRVGARDIDHFTRTPDAASFMVEMDGAGIDVAVMVARSVPGVRIDNSVLSRLAAGSGGRLVGVASIDPQSLGADTLDHARHALTELGLAGINLDAGFFETPLRADADVLLPLYALCQEHGVPAFVMSGPTTPDLHFNDPLAIDNVAKQFPKLPIVCCHGFYPNIDQMIGVAFRNDNVIVSPDMYVFAPGGDRYADAANAFMGDQFVFGSSFPFRPMRQGVEDFRALGLSDLVLERALYGNAKRVLGMGRA